MSGLAPYRPPMTAEVLNLRQPQAERLARFAADASVDVHCHCLPGLDDGPDTLAAAVAVCRALVADGITSVVATPHQLGPFEEVTAAAIRSAVAALRAELVAQSLPLAVHAGAEVRVDERLVDRLAAGEVLTLADAGVYVLVELPHSTMLDLRPLVEAVVALGITPIVAHPERHQALIRSPHLVLPWLDLGARLQVTAASLVGGFGGPAAQAAWQMIDAGWVSVIASDAHDVTRRPPAITTAIDAVAARLGHAVARRLCVQHPQFVLQGRPLPRPAARRPRSGGRA